MSRIVLARPTEASILHLLGWEEIGEFSQSFKIMKLVKEPKDTSLVVDLRKMSPAQHLLDESK